MSICPSCNCLQYNTSKNFTRNNNNDHQSNYYIQQYKFGENISIYVFIFFEKNIKPI